MIKLYHSNWKHSNNSLYVGCKATLELIVICEKYLTLADGLIINNTFLVKQSYESSCILPSRPALGLLLLQIRSYLFYDVNCTEWSEPNRNLLRMWQVSNIVPEQVALRHAPLPSCQSLWMSQQFGAEQATLVSPMNYHCHAMLLGGSQDSVLYVLCFGV